MNDADGAFLLEYEALFRELDDAWRGSDSADPIEATKAQYVGFEEIIPVITCGFGMVANLMRTSSAAIELTKSGFGGETGPLVRLVFEQAMAIHALGMHGFKALEAFGRAHANNLRRLQSVSAFGHAGVQPAESAWMDEFRAAAASSDAGPADNAIKVATIGTGGDETMAMLYLGWLRTTQTSHAGLMSSRNYVRGSEHGDGSVSFQRMYTSDYPFADCRITLIPAVVEALLGYTRLGPSTLEKSLPPILRKFDSLNARYLFERGRRT